MTKPELINEKPIPMYELKEELEKIKKRDEELEENAKASEEYLKKFLKIKKQEAEKLKQELEKLNIPRLKEQHIAKIIDLLPKTPEDVKLVLEGYSITITNENIKKIAECVSKYNLN